MTRDEAQTLVINLSEQLRALSELCQNSEGEMSKTGYSGLSTMLGQFSDELSLLMEFIESRSETGSC